MREKTLGKEAVKTGSSQFPLKSKPPKTRARVRNHLEIRVEDVNPEGKVVLGVWNSKENNNL